MDPNRDSNPVWSNRVVFVAVIFVGFAVAHFVDEFLFDVPAEFNLSNEISQVLGFIFFSALVGLVALSARGGRSSYTGLMVIGCLLALADALKHIPEMLKPDPFRSGFVSIFFALGMIVTGLSTAAVAFLARKRLDAEQRGRISTSKSPIKDPSED